MTQDNDQEAHNWSMLCHLGSIVWIPPNTILVDIGNLCGN